MYCQIDQVNISKNICIDHIINYIVKEYMYYMKTYIENKYTESSIKLIYVHIYVLIVYVNIITANISN